jgi:hypothetical protein
MFTPNLALSLIAASQAQKPVPVNEALPIRYSMADAAMTRCLAIWVMAP